MNTDQNSVLSVFIGVHLWLIGFWFCGWRGKLLHSVHGTVSFSGYSDCGGGAADAAVKGPAGARRCDAWIAGPAWGGACRVISARAADRSRLYARGVSADFRARGGALHLAAAGKRGAVQL